MADELFKEAKRRTMNKMDLRKLKSYKSKDEEIKFEDLNHNNRVLLDLIHLCISTFLHVCLCNMRGKC